MEFNLCVFAGSLNRRWTSDRGSQKKMRMQGLGSDSGHSVQPLLMHTLGIEPRSQAWKACMMPLHYVCLILTFSHKKVWVRRFSPGRVGLRLEGQTPMFSAVCIGTQPRNAKLSNSHQTHQLGVTTHPQKDTHGGGFLSSTASHPRPPPICIPALRAFVWY